MGVAANVRIEVEPDVLVQAGQKLSSIGSQLGMLAKALGEALGSGIASGIDPAGANFGIKYGHQAEGFAKRMANATDAHNAVGFMLRATGYNYENADAASTIGGSGPAGSVGAPPDTSPVADTKGINGVMVPPPAKWALIQTFLGPMWSWPSGNASMMRITAAQWRNFANGLSAFDDEMSALNGAVSQQHIPEAGKIREALTDLPKGLASMAEAATGMAKAIDDFAIGVQDTQDAIRDLMDRISLDGLWDTVTGFLTGDGDDILREVAHDVKELLENFQSQVKGVVGLLGELTSLLGSAADAFEKWVRPILVEALGDEVGNAAADYVTWNVDVGVGAVTGLINTVSGVVSLADLDTWKGLADVALSVAEDPTKLPGVLENMGKQFVAWDKWSGDHPGRAAGEAAFNIGTLFVPGGALAKGGSVAKSLSYASRLFEEGRLPRISDLPGLGGASRDLPGFDGVPEVRAGVPDLPEFNPGAVPDSIVSPSAPNAIDAPTSPASLGDSGGPPDPPGSTGIRGGGDGDGSGGGDGPPPDSPGRPVGPPDSGPGRVDGPTPQTPSPGHVESPQISDPSAPPAAGPASPSGEATAPTVHNAPEPSSPTATHDGAPSSSEPGTSPASHAPTTPEASGAGPTTEHRGDGNVAPGESHRAGSDDYSGRPDDRVHTPTEQPAQAPATPHPGGSERPATDSTPTREHSPATGNVDGQRHEPVAATPAGAGMPMAPHASGPTHTPGESSSASGKTPAAESTTRNPESKVSPSASPESPRAQPASAATGATAGNAPTASVNPTSAQSLSGAALESTRVTPEPPAPRPGDGTRDVPPSPHPAPHEALSGTAADRPGTQPDPSHSNQNANTHNQSPDPTGPVGNPADSRVYGPHELDSVEDPAYQTAVEDALRDADGNTIVHADPRTNDYGNLVNDGGPTVDGRSNNCLDCSLSALSSFLGDPTVSAPRWLDELPDGTRDNAGEHGGLRRAEAWLGSGMLEFPGISVIDQFNAVHQYVTDLGPGSAALVHNGWHARDLTTGDFLHHPDGSPVTRGSHATVVVHPDGGGPVWWDPQHGLTSDHPPSWMTDRSSFLHFTPIDPTQGAHHGGAGNQGTGTGVSGGNVAERDIRGASVPPRMGGHEGPEPRADGIGRGAGTDEAGDRLADGDHLRVPELVGHDGGRSLHGVQADGHQQGGPPDLSVPVAHHDPAGPGGRPDDRVSADGTIADRSTGTEPTVSADDREADVRLRSEELTVDQGDVSRGSGESSKPGHLAGEGDDPGVISAPPDQPAEERWGESQSDHTDDQAGPYDADAPGDAGVDHRYVQLDDGTEHRVWASSEHLKAQASRFVAADAWLAERGLARSDIQPLLVQPADWLNGAQRELVYGFRHEFPDVTSGEGLQKVIDTGQADGRLADGPKRYPPDETGGSVSIARDTRELDTPERIYHGLGLDYEDTPFAPDKPVVAMRFTVDDDVSVPVPDGQLSERAGHGSSFDPPGYEYPFTGTGFTASDGYTVPEYFLPGRTVMHPGAEMYRINPDGSEELMAVLNDNEEWIGVTDDG